MKCSETSSVKTCRINSWYVLLFLIVLLFAATYGVAMNKRETIEPEDVVVPPKEVMVPCITLTDEMMIDVFFDRLDIDSSIIEPEEIMMSIRPWRQYIQHYSSQYGVDPDLVCAIMYAESKGDPYCISDKGALGLMQVMPSTADFIGMKSNVLDPEANIETGVKYISWLTKYYDETHLLWAWNAGPSSLMKNYLPDETKKFIIEVLTVKTFLKGEMKQTI
ncbi:MAG TPA: lytic transglycosylase domain-containing protein [Anaerolineae bacterium]|nr:lytic transglycosylase domain-containing protein [Anaerolineae bacterium]